MQLIKRNNHRIKNKIKRFNLKLVKQNNEHNLQIEQILTRISSE